MIVMFFVFIWPLSMLALGAYCYFFLRNSLIAKLLPLSILAAITVLMSRRWAVGILEEHGCTNTGGTSFDCGSTTEYDLVSALAQGLLVSNTANLIYLYLVFPFLVVLAFYLQHRRQLKT